jgi:hypothetical protein
MVLSIDAEFAEMFRYRAGYMVKNSVHAFIDFLRFAGQFRGAGLIDAINSAVQIPAVEFDDLARFFDSELQAICINF